MHVINYCLFQNKRNLSNSKFAILVKWWFVEFMEEKLPHCYSNKFTGVSKMEINCVILNAIYWKKINFVHLQLVYTETRRKQRMPNNFRAKFFHSFLKQTVINYQTKENQKTKNSLIWFSHTYGNIPNRHLH